ncbi:MAG: hypothetical protein FJX68_07625 [Alphaproteobacteria bacterium]|nr:hypothetical protein [Alphaproteobacteria bacterium]
MPAARRRAARLLLPTDPLGPTPKQQARNRYEEIDPATIDSGEQPIGRVKRNLTGNPLDRYRQRGNLSERQWRAGDRLRADHFLAGLELRVVQSYSLGSSGDAGWQMPAGERQAAARERLRRALLAAGPRLSAILIAVACQERPAGGIGGEVGRSGRNAEVAGMTLLTLALDVLADQYGL